MRVNRIARMILFNWWRVPGAFTKLWHFAGHTDQYPTKEKYDHIQYMMKRAILGGNVNVEVFGEDHLPKKPGFLLYGNHQGLFDVVAVLATCPEPVAAVLKKEMYTVPLIRQMAQATGSLVMDRDSMRQSVEVMRQVAVEVREGRNFLIFPEGTRSRDRNQMREFAAGSFQPALISQCPIVPVLFYNSWKVLDQPGSWPVDVEVHYLETIPYSEYRHLTSHQVAALVRGRLEEALSRVESGS